MNKVSYCSLRSQQPLIVILMRLICKNLPCIFFVGIFFVIFHEKEALLPDHQEVHQTLLPYQPLILLHPRSSFQCPDSRISSEKIPLLVPFLPGRARDLHSLCKMDKNLYISYQQFRFLFHFTLIICKLPFFGQLHHFSNTRQSVFEKGFLQDVRHNLWKILPG